MSDSPALFRAFPVLRQRLAFARCTQLPTRVQRLDALGCELEIADLWIKRDDETGALYGGNKPRKLDFILGDVLARKFGGVVTFGGIGTNHGLATAVYARQFGLRCILGLVHQPVTEKVRRNLLLDHAYGAELHYAPTIPRLVLEMLRVYAGEVRRGSRPYIIGPGGTSLLGVLGYVSAAFELKEQIDAGELPAPDWIFLPVGSGGTLAGLALGLKLAGLTTRIAGVLVNDIVPPTGGRLARLANRTHGRLRRLAAGFPFVHIGASEIVLERRFIGRGYGVPSLASRHARDDIARCEGIGAETTYTGKCLAALRAIAQDEPYRGRRILYWHTYSSAPVESHVASLPEYRALPLSFHELFHEAPVAD